MRRRHALLATTAGAALVGGLLLAPQAQADEHEEPAPASPSLCIELDVTIQDQQLAESLCLPPEGGGAPELPGLPVPPLR